jgi:hypothetical protein
MDALVSAARAELARIEGRIARLEAELVAARSESSKLEAFLEVAARLSVAPKLPSEGQPQRAGRPSGSKSATLVNTSIEAIRAAGRPLSIGNLIAAIRDAGLQVGGQNETANLAGYLSRDPRVKFTRNVGWHLPDQLIDVGIGVTSESATSDLLVTPPTPKQPREPEAGGGT